MKLAVHPQRGTANFSLDYAIEKCRNLDFGQLAILSHGYAGSSTAKDSPISVDDILKEAGDKDDCIDFVNEMIALERSNTMRILPSQLASVFQHRI